MNNFFLIALSLALLYYFFYQPSSKITANPPLSKATQTNLSVENKTTQTSLATQTKSVQTNPKLVPEVVEALLSDTIKNLKEDLTNSRKANQKLLEEVNLFQKNKELIKEAIEFHENFSSSLGREDTVPHTMPAYWKWQELTEPTVPKWIIVKKGEEYFSDKSRLAPEWIEYERKLTWNAFVRQRDKNEETVKQCQELLKRLKAL